MENREPPPPPDPETGLPEPPAAPPYRRLGKMDGSANGPGEPRSSPPEGRGPVLAWRNQLWWKDGFRPAIAFVLPLLVIVLTVKDQGIGWMDAYGYWLLLAGLTMLSVPYFRGRPFAAGAEWFRRGERWVSTYELISIQVNFYYGFYSIRLEDADGRKISIRNWTILENRALWDLVYNGIVHSAHNGRLALDRVTRRMLELPILHTDGMRAKPPLRSTIWSLLPLFSVGVLTPVVVGHAAKRLHSKRLAWGAVAYALPIPAFIIAAASVPSSDTAIDVATAGLVTGLIVTWMPGGLHAYRLRWHIFAAPRAEQARQRILAGRTITADRD